MGPNLRWTKWRQPLFKYAFRWGKFDSPYVAPKPSRWWMIWLKIPTLNRNWLSSSKAGDLELIVLKKAKLHQVGGEGFWDDTKISSLLSEVKNLRWTGVIGRPYLILTNVQSDLRWDGRRQRGSVTGKSNLYRYQWATWRSWYKKVWPGTEY